MKIGLLDLLIKRQGQWVWQNPVGAFWGLMDSWGSPATSLGTHFLLPFSQVIKREGTGTEAPMIGDRVFVHYTGWLLDGTKFDSSLDRKDKFSFDLGKGRLGVVGWQDRLWS